MKEVVEEVVVEEHNDGSTRKLETCDVSTRSAEQSPGDGDPSDAHLSPRLSHVRQRPREISFSLLRSSLSGTAQLPSAALDLVGNWCHVRSEGYSAFLADCAGLSWALRKVAERIHPAPRFLMEDGQLVCETVCLGAKMVREVLLPGETSFYEPNLKVEYTVSAEWDGNAFVAARQSPAVNKGRPTVQRRWIDGATGQLIIKQSWGGKQDFTAYYTRDSDGRL